MIDVFKLYCLQAIICMEWAKKVNIGQLLLRVSKGPMLYHNENVIRRILLFPIWPHSMKTQRTIIIEFYVTNRLSTVTRRNVNRTNVMKRGTDDNFKSIFKRTVLVLFENYQQFQVIIINVVVLCKMSFDWNGTEISFSNGLSLSWFVREVSVTWGRGEGLPGYRHTFYSKTVLHWDTGTVLFVNRLASERNVLLKLFFFSYDYSIDN
jgi:hypothetical protein